MRFCSCPYSKIHYFLSHSQRSYNTCCCCCCAVVVVVVVTTDISHFHLFVLLFSRTFRSLSIAVACFLVYSLLLLLLSSSVFCLFAFRLSSFIQNDQVSIMAIAFVGFRNRMILTMTQMNDIIAMICNITFDLIEFETIQFRATLLIWYPAGWEKLSLFWLNTKSNVVLCVGLSVVVVWFVLLFVIFSYNDIVCIFRRKEREKIVKPWKNHVDVLRESTEYYFHFRRAAEEWILNVAFCRMCKAILYCVWRESMIQILCA